MFKWNLNIKVIMVNTTFVAVSCSGLFESRLAAPELFSELSFSVDEDTLIPSSFYSGFGYVSFLFGGIENK